MNKKSIIQNTSAAKFLVFASVGVLMYENREVYFVNLDYIGNFLRQLSWILSDKTVNNKVINTKNYGK